MLIPNKGHNDIIQVYSVTVMTHVKVLQAGHSSQGTSEPITPAKALDHPGPLEVVTEADCASPTSGKNLQYPSGAPKSHPATHCTH